MLVRDWMTKNVITLGLKTTVVDAAEIMRTKKIRQFPVIDVNGSLVGIVSDRDIRDAMPSKYLPGDAANGGSLDSLRERSQGFFPADPDPFEMEALRRTLALNVPEHHRTIERAARKWRLDPYLLTAIIHQESRFDPDAVSATGVRGLMQLTGPTLTELNVKNPDDPVEIIHAGARYLDLLRRQFVEMGYDAEDAMLLALASFNVGQGHVQDAIDLLRGENDESDELPSWFGVRQVLPLLSDADVARQTRYGLCRGAEAVEFVDKVRYFAFAIRGLVLASAQGNELPSLRLALAD